jgi:hypothetical protein
VMAKRPPGSSCGSDPATPPGYKPIPPRREFRPGIARPPARDAPGRHASRATTAASIRPVSSQMQAHGVTTPPDAPARRTAGSDAWPVRTRQRDRATSFPAGAPIMAAYNRPGYPMPGQTVHANSATQWNRQKKAGARIGIAMLIAGRIERHARARSGAKAGVPLVDQSKQTDHAPFQCQWPIGADAPLRMTSIVRRPHPVHGRSHIPVSGFSSGYRLRVAPPGF